MVSLIDVISVSGSTSSGGIPNLFLTILLFFFAATTALVSYPPAFLKKKYEDYKMARGVLKGQDLGTFTTLELAGRLIKYKADLEVTGKEDIVQLNLDVGAMVTGETDPALIRKYWAFYPGLTYDQSPDGYHVKITGDEHECILMSSLSYWGFHVNKEVREYAFQKVLESGSGNHGSYLLLGKNTVVEESYEALKRFFNRKYCIFSASGFLACMNLVGAIAPRGGVIFMDEKCHVCLRFGGKVAGCKVFKFPHQNYDALEKMMAQNRHKYAGRALLVVDSIYSADGTIANLPRAREVCDKYNVTLVMDEAHSLGSIGKTGRGIEEHFNMPGACDFICGVFSKTLSSYGGYVVSNDVYTDCLNISPGVGFATGPHSFSAATVTKAIEIIERDGLEVRSKIDKMRAYYVQQLTEVSKACNIIHCGHNVFVSFPHMYAACTVAVEMRKRGYLMSSFMFPSVPTDRSILRLTVTPLTTKEILDGFCKTLGEAMEDLVPRFGRDVMFGRHNAAYYEEISHS
tara:strand:+ start:1817 stop:3364 length:1548 start_codon:yes stop_codon:yes gene_type:complete